MAPFRTEIELRVKVLDAELNRLEKRYKDIERAANSAFRPRSNRTQSQRNQLAEATLRTLRQQRAELVAQNAQLKIAEERSKRIATAVAATTKSLQRRASAAVGGGLIGAGFPALFGASSGEIAGGGIGGILGGLAGGQSGAFTGSIIGSAIGKLTEAQSKIKDISKDLGFTGQQAEVVSAAFEKAGLKGADAFQRSLIQLQSVGLELEDQVSLIKASSNLVNKYGGSLDKTLSSVNSTILKGKVGISDLNKLQNQGIPIQEELARKLDVSRSELLQLAKDGKVSVKDLTDSFIDLALKAEDAPKKAQGEFDRLQKSILDAARAVGTLATELLRVLEPALNAIAATATRALNAINDLVRLGPVGDLQREITGGKLTDIFTFGATPDTVNSLANSLSNLSAKGIQSADALNTLEVAVARANKRSREFQGKAGELAVTTVQPQITRLQNEIAAARARLESGATPEVIKRITPPSQLAPSGGGGGRAAKPQDDTKAAEDLLRSLVQQRNVLTSISDLDKEILEVEFERENTLRRIGEYKGISDELRNQLSIETNTLAQLKEKDAILTNVFEKTAAATQAARNALLPLEDQRKLLEAKLNGTEKEARLEIEIAQATRGKNADLAEEIELRMRANAALQDQLDKQAELNSLFEGIGSTIQSGIIDAIGVGIDALINGTEELDDALQKIAQGVLADIGRQLISFGVRSLLGGLGGTDGVGVFSKLFPMAEGGYVTGPTPAIVGEGGEPEYVIPASKMDSAMSKYSAGQRGGSLVDNTGAPTAGGDTMVAEAPTQITINGGVMQMGNDQYIRKDEIPSIVKQASKQGEALALRKLQMSPSARRKVGI